MTGLDIEVDDRSPPRSLRGMGRLRYYLRGRVVALAAKFGVVNDDVAARHGDVCGRHRAPYPRSLYFAFTTLEFR